MFSNKEVKHIFKEAKNDIFLKSTINIEEIINNADNTNNYLKTKKMKEINKEIFDVLCTLNDSEIAEKYANKL